MAGVVHNVVARLPGRDPSRAVLLVAHYDSVPTAAGAADDGSGVAALLETARALRSGPSPRNDIIFLFTDGEERGLLGSQAFLQDDPWAYAAGVVLNFDSPGSSSPALMYETSPGNGLLVSHYLAAGQAYGSSLMYEVSRRQPVVSDFRPFVARGIPGMTFGMLDGPAVRPHGLRLGRDVQRGGPAARGRYRPRAGPPPRRRRPLAAPRSGRRLLRRDRQPRRVVPGASWVTPFLALAVSALRRRGRGGGAPPPAHAPRRRLGDPRDRRDPGRVALRRRARLDDVPHRLRGACLDGHRRRDQRLVPGRPRPARVGGRARHLRGPAAPAARLGPRRRRAGVVGRRGGGREPRLPRRELPADVVAGRRRARTDRRRPRRPAGRRPAGGGRRRPRRRGARHRAHEHRRPTCCSCRPVSSRASP